MVCSYFIKAFNNVLLFISFSKAIFRNIKIGIYVLDILFHLKLSNFVFKRPCSLYFNIVVQFTYQPQLSFHPLLPLLYFLFTPPHPLLRQGKVSHGESNKICTSN